MGQNECKLKNGDVVKYAPAVYGRGEYKTAHLGQYISGDKAGKDCIVKVFKNADAAFRNGNTVRITRLARKLAAEFNKLEKIDRPLRFLVPQVAVISKVAKVSWFHTSARTGDIVTVEERIRGKYEKFISNNGTLLFHGTLSTFSHWTYWKSKEKFMIVDLQGERRENEYILTDPAIHSGKGFGEPFGELDCGMVGIEAFFSTHRCEKVCKGLPVPSNIIHTPKDCENLMRKRLSRRR